MSCLDNNVTDHLYRRLKEIDEEKDRETGQASELIW